MACTFDLTVRMQENYREDVNALRRLPIQLPEGGTVPLGTVARIYESGGPNTVNRENVRRRVVIQCNVAERGVVDVVQDIKRSSLRSLNRYLPATIQLTKASSRANNPLAE